MTRDQARQASSDARLEHVRLKTLERHKQAARDLERRRIAALVGPGHTCDLAPDAPLHSDPRLDWTGFAPGALL